MPNSTYEDAIREAFSLAPSNVAYLFTLQISHPLLPSGDIFLVRDRVNHALQIEGAVEKTFVACAFEFKQPSISDDGLTDLTLVMDDVSGSISDFLNQVSESVEPIEVTFRPYRSDMPSVPQMDPPLVLWLRSARKVGSVITGKATFFDLSGKQYLTDLYTRDEFPSLGNL